MKVCWKWYDGGTKPGQLICGLLLSDEESWYRERGVLGFGRVGAILGPIAGGLLATWHVGIQSTFFIFAIPGVIAAIVLFFVQQAADLSPAAT